MSISNLIPVDMVHLRLALIQRSIETLNLIYKIFVGNEDTKSYSKATTCGPLVYIKREEYTLRKDENETD